MESRRSAWSANLVPIILTASLAWVGSLFAATVAAGTGLGPAHPPICAVSETLTRRVPCVQVVLSTDRTMRLSSVLDAGGVRNEAESTSRTEAPVVTPHVPAEALARARISSEPAR